MIYVLIPTTPERSERLKKTLDSIKSSICDQEIKILTEVSEGEGANKPLKRLLDKVDGLVFPLGDDNTVEPDTLQLLYDAYIREFPDKDGMTLPAGSDSYLVHSDIMKKYFHFGYFHLYSDREFYDIMYIKRKTYRVKGAVVNHDHYTKKATLDDETYRLSVKHREADRELYEERKAKNFDLDL